jgi:hypothetical protein
VSFLDTILRTRSSDYSFGPITVAPGRLLSTAIGKQGAYISVLLRSARIVNVRRGWNKFYPVVHSYISLPHLDGKRAEFQTVTSPSKLLEFDASHIDRVININHRLLGPTPYRGGDLNLEIGLFSVKSDDLAKPFLSLLETMAGAAGVSYMSVAMPFVAPLKKGLESLTESNNINLEIGLSTSFGTPQTGYFFVARTEREKLNPKNITVSDDFRLVDDTGGGFKDFPYLIFSVEASESRDDWFLIPEISIAYKEIQETIRKGKRTQLEEVVAFFRRTVLTSPDLLLRHAQQLVKSVEDDVSIQMPASMTSAVARELRP